MHTDDRATLCFSRFFPDRRIAFKSGGLHRHFVTKGRNDSVIRPQVNNALFAIYHHMVAVQCLCGDTIHIDDQRDRQCAGHNRGVTANGSSLKDDTLQIASIIQQFGRADISRHQNWIGGHLCPCVLPLPREDAQKAVGQIIQITQAFPQITVPRLRHPSPRKRLFLLYGRFCAQSSANIGFHAAHPTFGIREHPIRF